MKYFTSGEEQILEDYLFETLQNMGFNAGATGYKYTDNGITFVAFLGANKICTTPINCTSVDDVKKELLKQLKQRVEV